MGAQAENLKRLVKGNNLESIIRALKLAKPVVRKTLMIEYNASSIQELALKLQ